jgi:creatinine amidohydrolase/Fe(II)-dependent formamide hydrolase-like protein
LVVLLVALAAATHARAAAAPAVQLEALTSTELAQRIRAGATTVLVPIGGTEQHGAHIALGKHNARAEALALRIAAALGNAIVAPVVSYVPEGTIAPPGGHMRYAGTISVPEGAFQQVLEGTARSLRAAGFRDIAFLGDHGGYQKSEEAVAARLNREWSRSDVRVHAVRAYYDAATHGFAALLRSRGYTDAEIGVHAGLSDTALTMALAPSLVRSERLDAARGEPGVTGDPRRATAELGEAGVALIVTQTVNALRAATRR